MDDNKFYVYEWYIINTGEVFYVGKGTGNRYKRLIGRNYFFQCMYDTHDCNVRKIYENLTEQEAFEKEIEIIKYYKENTNYRLTNQTDGGEGTSGWKPSKEFRKKQSEIHKKQWKDDDFRNMMLSIRQDENGVYKSEEFRNKISEIVKGENNPNYQNYWTDEQKENLRRIQKLNPLYKNENNPNSKKIVCIETGEIFDCIKYALEKYEIKNEASISVALKNPIRTASKMHWVEYSEDFLDKDYRFNYLIDVLSQNSHCKSIICLEDLSIYNSKTDLAKHLNVTTSKITWQLNKEGNFIHKNKTYILIKNYKSRFIQ